MGRITICKLCTSYSRGGKDMKELLNLEEMGKGKHIKTQETIRKMSEGAKAAWARRKVTESKPAMLREEILEDIRQHVLMYDWNQQDLPYIWSIMKAVHKLE